MNEANMWDWLDFEIHNIKRVFGAIFECMNSIEKPKCLSVHIFDLRNFPPRESNNNNHIFRQLIPRTV